MKAVLVIDMPENCMECKLEGYAENTGETYCIVNDRETGSYEEKPDWCPLKPLPEKKQIHQIDPVFLRGAKNGYNACIDEILKGVE